MANPIERLSNLGYGAMIPEVTPGVALTPNVFIKYYKNTLNLNVNLDEDNPVAGVRSNPFNQYPGMRSYEGALDVLAEPNNAEHFFNMLLAAGSITGGSDPYTHPFTEGLSASYTMEFQKGQIVERYFGVQAEDIESAWNKNKMQFNINVSALGSFIVGQIATVATTTITLDTTKDPSPTKGLVAGDLVRVMKSDGSSTLDTTIAVAGVNADGITLTLGASAAAFAAGDFIFLRAQTPSYVDLTPFMWARTQFQFGTSASAALSAAQLRLETGSKWKITHKFNKKQGEDRSGSFDPASLARLQTEAELTLKMFFDQPQKLMNYLNIASTSALVIKHFSGSNHELRVTFNQLRYKMDKRDIESAKLVYEEITGR
ncbi:MAG: hypothetical protein KGI08_11085, partial [Thaumarchaeota archaeon]|nr:hypothetical protein [Nitrososphaerota archaeon]